MPVEAITTIARKLDASFRNRIAVACHHLAPTVALAIERRFASISSCPLRPLVGPFHDGLGDFAPRQRPPLARVTAPLVAD